MVLPDSPRVPRVPGYSGTLTRALPQFRLRVFHPLWKNFPELSAIVINDSDGSTAPSINAPQPRTCNACELIHMYGLGYSRFARRYSGNRVCFLFLRLLRWFSSPRSPLPPMYSVTDDRVLPLPGFPIRKSPVQSLLAARRSLSQLSTSFIASWRQGIHRVPLVACSLTPGQGQGTV